MAMLLVFNCSKFLVTAGINLITRFPSFNRLGVRNC